MDVLPGILLALLVLAVINFSAYASMGMDKARAMAGSRRIAEWNLLLLALLGGTLGTYAGRRKFSHKTLKQPFGTWLLAIAVLQGAALALAFGWLVLSKLA